MLVTRDEVVAEVTNTLLRGATKKGLITERVNELVGTHGLPKDLAIDLICLNKQLIDQTDFVLYCVADVSCPTKVKQFFTDKEIEEYSKHKFIIPKITFPIKKQMVAVTDNQWIGSISVKELMLYRDAQLINYNENTQRTLKRVNVGNFEYYQIFINRKQVNSIMDSYRSGIYIPNTITLNMPEDTEFSYDGENLIIKSIEAFDIIDGYHRYIAMSNLYNLNEEFDYTMELRLVCFSEEVARQFIWQEDQKTQMTKIDSDSFNQSDPANQVVNLLNQKAPCNGIITRNNGIIDSSILAQMISTLFFSKKENNNRKNILAARDLLLSKINVMADEDYSILDKPWKRNFILAFTVLSSMDIDDNIFLDEVKKLSDAIKNDSELISRNVYTVRYMTRVKKLYNSL